MNSQLIVRMGFVFVFVFSFQVLGQGAPVNDDFANRSLLQGANFHFSGTTYLATQEAEEFRVNSFEASVWWRWIPPIDGIATISSPALVDGNSELEVFRGASPFLNYQSSNNLARLGGASGELTNFRVRGGQEYSLGLFGYRLSDAVAAFTVSLAAEPAAPGNDNFADRIVLTGANPTFGGSTFGATLESAEDVQGVATDNDASVWWSWTAPGDGFASLFFEQAPIVSERSPFLRVQKGDTLGSLSYLAGITVLSKQPAVFRTRTGETFSFGMRGKASTNLALSLGLKWAAEPPAPANDALGNRIQLQGAEATFSGNLYGSSHEAGESFPSIDDPSRKYGSIWWTWTASMDGFADLVLPATFASNSFFWIFKGGDSPSVATLGANIAQVTRVLPLTISIRTQAGENFIFGFSGRADLNATHQFVLSSRAPAPANDLFANPIALPSGSQEFVGTVYEATKEIGEPDLWIWGTGAGSVWYRWTPEVTGFAALTLPEPPPRFESPSELHVSRGTSIDSFANLENRLAVLLVRPGFYTGFPVTAGQSYTMALVGDPTTNRLRRFTLTVSEAPIILGQPTNQMVKPGGAAFFSVFAPGAGWGNVRWQFNGTDLGLGSSVGPTLGVYNVSVTNVGAYRAVISADGLSSTSAPAFLSLNDVERRPSVRLLRGAGMTNDFRAVVAGELNQSYVVEGSDDLKIWRWMNFSTPLGFYIRSETEANFRSGELSPVSMAFRAVRRGDLREACIVNLWRIHLAKEAWKVRYKKLDGSPIVEHEVDEFFGFGNSPRCPEGGFYAYNSLDITPICSVNGHSL